MLPILASILFLGIVSPAAALPPLHPLPGIDILTVEEPSPLQGELSVRALSASGVLVLDSRSGEEIFSRSADTRRPMASLTKIMTALLILERHELSETVVIPPLAEHIPGSTVNLVAGERLTVGDLLKALLLLSANDAAYALAIYDSRTAGAFVAEMNERAKALGLANTHFTNPAGLDSDNQYSTPRDLAWLTMAALRHPTFRSMVATKTARITAGDGTVHELRNTNELLHRSMNVLGVKTGTTGRAGECLVVLFEDKGRSYLVVFLGSSGRYTDGEQIMEALVNSPLQ